MSDEENEEHNTIFLKAPIVEVPPDEAPTSSGKLVCLDTSLVNSVPDGDEYWFESGEQSIGRGEECTVRIDSSEVSRVHARVTTYSDRWVIEDAESRNGTRVNDERISGKTVLAPGDMVHFGQVPFRFDVVDLLEQALDEDEDEDEDTEADVAISIDFPEPPPPPAPAAEVEEEITLELPGEMPEPAAPAAAPEPAPGSVPEPAPAPAAEEDDPDTEPGLALDEAPAPAEVPAPSEAPLAATAPPAALPKADVAMLREHVPQLVSLLLEHARGGDSAAARVCLEFLVHEEQRLPKDLGSTGAMGQMVKQILASMTQGELPPRQALDALQAIATARDLLGRPTGKSS